MRSIWLYSCLLGLLAAIPAAAQQTTPAPADQTTQASTAAPADAAPQAPAPDASAQAPAAAPAAAAPAAAPTWSAGPIDFAGTIDGYYNFNFNHPRPNGLLGGGNTGETNYLYNFDIPANQFSLNLVKLGMSHTPDPVGFEFDLGYGDTMTQIAGTGSEFDKIVEQAIIEFKPTKAKGFELDFGKFNTSAGAEVIESYSNWNESRSLLFSWAIPYYHYGVRTSWPMGKHWVGGFQVVNGWNDSLAINSGATLGANLMATYTQWNWMFDWYGGPGNAGTNMGWRNLFDTTFNITPKSPHWAAYINYDYGADTLYDNSVFKNNTSVHYQGIAGALRLIASSKWAASLRYEWFDDPDGFAMLGAGLGASNFGGSVPVDQQVQEFTGTLEYKFLEGLEWRAEYRDDWSNKDFFLANAGTCNVPGEAAPTISDCPADFGLGNSKHQQTLTFAIIAFFGPKR